MLTPLPEKIEITKDVDFGNLLPAAQIRLRANHVAVFSLNDLTPTARAKYEAYYEERAKRKDPSQEGVAQDALNCTDELRAQGRSGSEAFTVYGYSLRSTVMPAMKEFDRIVAELKVKPSAEVLPNPDVALVVADVMAARGIPEFIPEVVEK